MDDIIKYDKNDSPHDLTNKIYETTGGILPVKIAFEEPLLAKAIIENFPIKNREGGVADWITEGLILGGIPPGNFKSLENNANVDENKPYSLVLIYESLR
jgi:hypothetical protein